MENEKKEDKQSPNAVKKSSEYPKINLTQTNEPNLDLVFNALKKLSSTSIKK